MIASNKSVNLYVAKFFLMNMGISISRIFSIFIFDVDSVENCFSMSSNNKVRNVISNENTNFAFEFSEFEISEFECFGSISHSLITVLFPWRHKKVYINIVPIISKKREAGKLKKRCLTLDKKIKILDEVKKRNLSCRAVAEEFKIRQTQAANVVKNEAKIKEEFENFQSKCFKCQKPKRITKNSNLLMKFVILGSKNVETSGIYVSRPLA